MEKDTDTNVKIGLFGGTFNPVHLGHLRAAEEIREKFNLSKVIFIPVRIPPHKKHLITPSDIRFKMINMAIAGNSFFEISKIELQRQGSSYSFETIEFFNNFFQNKTDLYFIMGQDAFMEIHLWKKYPHFFSACHFIVMSRPGLTVIEHKNLIPPDIAMDFTYDSIEKCFVHKSGRCVYFCRITFLEISSTEIRKNLKEGKSAKYLLPEPVEQYIKEHNLY